MKEEWKIIEGTNEKYSVSNLGNVKMKKRILKPNFGKGKNCFDTGSDNKVDRKGMPITKDSLTMYGTPEQIANPNQLWENPKEIEGPVVTPKGYYPNMQSYIAATHGSAYDPNAPFEMFNNLVFNSAPMLFDVAYQGITGQYGKQGVSSPAQNIMGTVYQYTAPSRWLGSAKSLLPGYKLAAPWSDNNPGLTGDPNLDGVFDILTLQGLNESRRFNNLKNNIINKIKSDFNKLVIPYGELQNINAIRSYLSHPIKYNKVYREKLKFQRMLDKYPTFKEAVDLEPITYNKSSYDKAYDYFKIGTLHANKSLSEFINNIQSKKWKQLIDPNTIQVDLGYSNHSNLFGGTSAGYFDHAQRIGVVGPDSPYNTASALLHEGYSHATDRKIPSGIEDNYDLSNTLLPDANKDSKQWYESRATLNELAYKIWLDAKKPDWSEFYDAVNKLTEDQLLNELRNISDYGYDYSKGIKSMSSNDKTATINKIKNILKFLPATTAPIILRKPNNNTEQ